MKDRIKKIQEYSGLSLGVFASRTGIKSASLSHILNGRNNPSLDVVMKIHETFPEISWEWMLYGTGPMLNGGNDNTIENRQVEPNFAASPAQTNRTIFDNDPVKSDETDFEKNNEEDEIDYNIDTNVDDLKSTKTIEDPSSKPAETTVIPQKSETEIIDSFINSESFKNIVDAHSKAKEKAVKKIIVLYDDDTFAEYSLNRL
ncbi:MAG: helix-turn-helix domain-containing protein [Paludibacteraceae bacterium]|nr:helix-turn-helix domain-containing protein [Paludibacteraceae bacterium]